MQVHFGEGLATHTGPEPCVDVREDVGEASAGECIGQPLSREIVMVPGADVVCKTEGNTHEHTTASARAARRVRRPWHVQTLLAWEPGDLMPDRAWLMPRPVRIGKVRSRSR